MNEMNYKERLKEFMFYVLCGYLTVFCGIGTLFTLVKIATIIFPEG